MMTTWEVSLFQFEAMTEDSKHLGEPLYRIQQGRNSSWGVRDETNLGSPQQAPHPPPFTSKKNQNFTDWGHIPLPTNTTTQSISILKLRIWCTNQHSTSNKIK